MAILTESRLHAEATQVTFSKIASYEKRTTVFLSHSHHDRELAKGFIGVLASQGVTVYVDWNDSSMPRITNGDTARKIKQRIEQMSIFAVLYTRRAMESRWVPWEIGIADQKKGEKQVMIVPVADASGRYVGNEYMQLYRHFEVDSAGRGRIVKPDESVLLSESARDFLQDNVVYG